MGHHFWKRQLFKYLLRNVVGEIIMKKLVLLLSLLTAPMGISTAFAGSCGGGDHTHTDEKKETK